jgi:ABC-type Zn uptake system ZnuABC Zn-binding protein ZnuA
MNQTIRPLFMAVAAVIAVMMLMAGCAAPAPVAPAADAPGAATEEVHSEDHDDDHGHGEEHAHDAEHDHAADTSALPALTPVALGDGEKLRVVVTTNIVGDVVSQVAGDAIEMVQLLPIGADPHTYQARPDDLRHLNNAHVVFINGLHLEETMQPVLDNLDTGAPVISVNIGVPTLQFGADHADEHETAADQEHHHEGADPHTWMDVHNVEIWVDNIAAVLSALDPAHADRYAANAAAYRTQLEELHEEIAAMVATIPVERRKLVTDHDNLAYLANAHGFTVVGTVIPSISTLASPSARDLAALQRQIEQEGIRAIFVGTTVNPAVAARIASDTGAVVVPIYTASLSDAQGPAATYIDMMRHTVQQIVEALAN